MGKWRLILLVIVVTGVFLFPFNAGATVITFDELPYQPVDGVHIKGVTFGYTLNGSASTEAYYNYVGGPSNIEYVQTPWLEGNAAGILTLDFDGTTSMLNFGFVLSTYDDIVSPGVTVEMFDALSNSLGVYTADAFKKDYGTYYYHSEGFFSYVSETGAVIKKAVIDFPESLDITAFVLDNLEHDNTVVPEPSTMAVFGLGMLALARRGRKSVRL